MVIAKPIILKIAEIPLFGIPLAIFPHQGGRRHSGWIMPAYGESKSRGQYIDGLGFYWAPNDYWDSKFTLSFGDRQGAVFNVKNQYRLRYKYSGSLYVRNQQFLSNSEDIISLKENRNSNFNVRWNHTQKLRNNQNFNANEFCLDVVYLMHVIVIRSTPMSEVLNIKYQPACAHTLT